MGKWKVVQGKDHPTLGGKPFWSVSEVDGSKLIFITRNKEIANLVVREHNAHEVLVRIAELYKAHLADGETEYGSSPIGVMTAIGHIDAVLAQAK